jgi:hypothetical protein
MLISNILISQFKEWGFNSYAIQVMAEKVAQILRAKTQDKTESILRT